jgi:hypothetical protein
VQATVIIAREVDGGSVIQLHAMQHVEVKKRVGICPMFSVSLEASRTQQRVAHYAPQESETSHHAA